MSGWCWYCCDEFNRLEERMLSAVSQQVQTIQEALKEQGLQKGKLSDDEKGFRTGRELYCTSVPVQKGNRVL